MVLTGGDILYGMKVNYREFRKSVHGHHFIDDEENDGKCKCGEYGEDCGITRSEGENDGSDYHFKYQSEDGTVKYMPVWLSRGQCCHYSYDNDGIGNTTKFIFIGYRIGKMTLEFEGEDDYSDTRQNEDYEKVASMIHYIAHPYRSEKRIKEIETAMKYIGLKSDTFIRCAVSYDDCNSCS